MAKPKSKGHANVKVATKNSLRTKRKAASKRRRASRKEVKRKKSMESKMKGTHTLPRFNKPVEDDDDLDDLIEMTDAEYLPRVGVPSAKT
jgi:hypothetical protein